MRNQNREGLASAELEEHTAEGSMGVQSRIPLSPSPQWSLLTLRSFDITFNLPPTSHAMDLGDSPWDGMPYSYEA